MSPEQLKKLDGWILGLQLAIGNLEKWGRIVGVTSDFGLPDLLEVIQLLRAGRNEGAIEALGLKKTRGGQPDYQNALVWNLMMAWVEAARAHQAVKGKETLSDFLDILVLAGEDLRLRSQVPDLSTLEKYRKKYKSESKDGDCFKLKGGLTGSIAHEVVDYLESQSKLRLWHGLPFSELPVDLFKWSFESPGNGWYEASLNWSECG